MAGRALPRKPVSLLDHKLSGEYVKVQDQEVATSGIGRRRSSGVRVLRLGGRRVRRITWRLRTPKLKLISLRFVSPTFLLRKLRDAYIYFMRVEAKADDSDKRGEHICMKYEKAYMAYVQRTVAEGRFYRNGVPILDLKDL